jgi:hypothetical protein
MRLFVRISMVVCALVATTAGPVRAATITIGELTSDRVFRDFGGGGYENIWSRLADPANFGPGGIVPHSVALAPPLPIATSGALAKLDIFIMPEVFTPFAPEEAAAVAEFVRNGGCLVVISNTLHASDPPGGNGTVPGNAVLSLLDGTHIEPFDLTGEQSATAGTITSLAAPLTDGPFGTFTIGDSYAASWHTPLTMGSEAQSIGVRNGTTVLALIEGGALGEGSGAVMINGDVLFNDLFIPPGDQGGIYETEANTALFMNFVAMHAAMIPEVPEPSTLSLLAAAAALLPFGGRRRR